MHSCGMLRITRPKHRYDLVEPVGLWTCRPGDPWIVDGLQGFVFGT